MERKKSEIVRHLGLTKLILGNGFDLYCGLKTSYKDYFLSLAEENGCFDKFLSTFDSRWKTFCIMAGRASNTIYDFWKSGFDLKDFNFWDFFFFLISRSQDPLGEWKWCDIEQAMCSWLRSGRKQFEKGDSFESVYSIIVEGKIPCLGTIRVADYLACVLYLRHGRQGFCNKTEFYVFLKNELALFENKFGNYIYKQQHIGRSVKPDFEKRSRKALAKLCDPELIRTIDTFNYGILPLKDDRVSYHHINGNTSNPIFGVDSDAFRAPDPRYIFTKTSRRMELDMSTSKISEPKTFENVVVFGSSLALADYGYFFSVFDKMDIANINSPSKIVFAYSIFNQEKATQIKMNLNKSIFCLLQDYSIYKGNKAHPNRLLDSLTTHGKVVLFDVGQL